MRFQVSVTVALFAVAAALAGGRLQTIRYRGGVEGRVVFDHQMHASNGFRCNDCHTNFAGSGKPLFTTRKHGLITSADHRTDGGCFACHDGKGPAEDGKNPNYSGKGAFDDCERCHYKGTAPRG